MSIQAECDAVISDLDLENYADVLVWALSCSRIPPLRNKDLVVISFDLAAAPLADAVFHRLLDAHLHPAPVARKTSAMEAELLRNGSFGQLVFQTPGELELLQAAAGVITLLAPESLDHLQDVDMGSIAAGRRAALSVNELVERRRRRGDLGYTVCLYPTPGLARVAGMECAEYAEALIRACGLREPSPTARWRRRRRELGEIAAWLTGLRAKAFRVESENMDLTVQLGEYRRFAAVSGQNIPAYELYVSPDWRGVDGIFFADMPSIRHGRMVSRARLEFHHGQLTEVRAERGERFIVEQLKHAENAGRVGELSFTDRRYSLIRDFMAHALFDENFGGEHGNCHVALGASLPETFSGPAYELTVDAQIALGFNGSSIHWDLVNTEQRTVTALLRDGSRLVVYENGQFIV
ncbi:MAG: aminopeptidase [Desulfovibrionaceae bacterium]